MRLRRVVADDLLRHGRHLVLASVGVVFGVATFVFFLALGAGVRAVILGEIFPLDQLEVAPRRLEVDVLALRLGIGSETLDDEAVQRLAAISGVRAVYPKMDLTVPAVMTAGAGLLGADIYTEVVADGIDPDLVAADIGKGHEFRDLDDLNDPRNPSPMACSVDRDCPDSGYCSPDLGVCRSFIPVVVSPHLVELYNGSLARSHGFPKLNPDVALGLTAELSLGSSMFRSAERQRVVRERLRLVGFSDKAIPLGVTMPVGYVKRFNALFGSDEAAEQYHSAIVEVVDKGAAARVAEGVRALGFEVTDRGAERAALLIAVLMAAFALVSASIVAVAAVNIMHAFFMLVYRRQREIGVMRAVGATRADIRRIILGEAAVVGLGAGVVGVVLAWLAAMVVDLATARWVPDFPYKPESMFQMSPGLVAAALALGVLACVLGAALPATRAAARDAAEVLSGQ